MEELFDLGQKGPERTDISLWIFPHLREFLAVDLRWDPPQATLLNTADVFGDNFFSSIEGGFSHILREHIDYPFAHLIDLPLKIEELVRETGMLAILERLGRKGAEDEFPTVGVLIVSGAALTMNPEQIELAFRSLLGEEADPAIIQECSDMLGKLLVAEHEVVKRLDRQELREAMEEQSPMYLTLWERRN